MRCSFCSRPAVAVCRLCGRPVCENHFDLKRGICIACSETLCYMCGSRLAVASCIVCGKPVCTECSIEVKPGIRMCKNCFRKYGGYSVDIGGEAREKLSRLTSTIYRYVSRV